LSESYIVGHFACCVIKYLPYRLNHIWMGKVSIQSFLTISKYGSIVSNLCLIYSYYNVDFRLYSHNMLTYLNGLLAVSCWEVRTSNFNCFVVMYLVILQITEQQHCSNLWKKWKLFKLLYCPLYSEPYNAYYSFSSNFHKHNAWKIELN